MAFTKMDKMFSIERKSEILKLVEQNGRIGVNELSTLFKFSRETIRRDLREMEGKGLLKRTHGGAVFDSTLSSAARGFPVGIREIQRYKEKDEICRSAAFFIRNGDSIFVDNSPLASIWLSTSPPDFILRSSPIPLSCLWNRWNRTMQTS